MGVFAGVIVGIGAWFFLRYILSAFYTVNQNERAVKTIFGRAERVGTGKTGSIPHNEMLTHLIAAGKPGQ